ncbi:MAG: hypothetical protein JNK68_05225 [Betaproteobacteria bacterium]|nr:hypothetical protein [Betaproteobacteria bacterium]
MSIAPSADLAEYGPWNPGIASELPPRLTPLATIFRPENVYTSLNALRELQDLTGLPREELVVFRPQRLAVHELLIRVTADLTVPDGSRVEDLGINFRRMTHTILTGYLQPHMATIVAAYEAAGQRISEVVTAELRRLLQSAAAPETAPRSGALAALLRRLGARREAPPRESDAEREERVLRNWAHAARSRESSLERAAFRALHRVVSVVRAKHGRVWGDAGLLAPIATGMACNEHGAEVVGDLIGPHVARAVAAEGYRWLPTQERPVVMNTKGASASGKSTLRPLQKRLAAEIDVAWNDFALISPDIWRKYLLDYGSLGEHFRYAGTFTGLELAVVDQKLDLYMARKAERRTMSHLLIDRFRFDSFAADSDEAGSNLLTRFARLAYLFFMITPPHETVERSWKRGLEVGRFKAVDDLLAHNVEAYTGMPELFFTWALRTGMAVHYEFLDNDVPYGERPRTVAFGWNGDMVILDVKRLLDIDRYRKIDVDARQPEQVYPGAAAMAADCNTQFLRDCARRLASLTFADRDSGRIYARAEAGRLSFVDPEALEVAARDPQTRAGLLAVSSEAFAAEHPLAGAPALLDAARYHTLGCWGDGS